MSEDAKSFHFIFDHQNIEALRKMVTRVARDQNTWLDIMYKPEGSDEKGLPTLEFAEMLWDADIRQAVVIKDAKYEAQPSE
jgi:hypothetical protein